MATARRLVRASCCVLLLSALAPAAEPDLVTAAARALAAGRAHEVVYLLAQRPEAAAPGRGRLLLAAGQLALGRPAEARDVLDLATDPPRVWPPALVGRVAQLGARIAIAEGRIERARLLLGIALEHPGHGVDVPECLVRLAACSTSGAGSLRRSCLQRVWGGWHASLWRLRGGLLLAGDLANEDPDAARQICTEIMVHPDVSDAVRTRAVLILAAILREDLPQDALGLVRDELERIDRAAAPEHWAALRAAELCALARLDRSLAAQRLAAAPASVRERPELDAVRAQLAVEAPVPAAAAGQEGGLGRALALLKLGQTDAAGPLLEAHAAQDPVALAALVALPQIDPTAWSTVPAARTPRGGLALIQAWQRRDDPASARAAFARAHPEPDAPLAGPAGAARRRLLVAGALLLRETAPQEYARLRDRLRKAGGESAEAGIAWAWYARDKQGAETASAWRQAATLLPSEHPWLPLAALRGARDLLAAVPPGHRLSPLRPERQQALEQAVTLLGRGARAQGEPGRRCRFLLVQALAQLGRQEAALAAMEPLRAHADADQAQRLEALTERLRDGSASSSP
ncbi:MAG: hypothetical protein ACOCZK_01265 [Planctomycetota bacterium]